MPDHIIHRHISNDGIIEITQSDHKRALYFGSNTKQSEMDVRQPDQLILSYTQSMMAALLFCPAPKSILLIGLGGGSLAKFIFRHLPQCGIDVVEYREDVVKLAHAYFCLPEDPRLNVVVDDGLHFLEAGLGRYVAYDLIMVDAFDHIGVSDSVKAPYFFSSCQERLKKDGILAVNLWNNQQDRYHDSLDSLRTTFNNNVLTLPVKDKENVIAFAGNSPQPMLKSGDLKATAKKLKPRMELDFMGYLRQLRRAN